MPVTGAVLAVVDVSLTTIVDEPSRLPIVLPVTFPILNPPVETPKVMPIKADEPAVVEARLDV
jgi:hypothetical protein